MKPDKDEIELDSSDVDDSVVAEEHLSDSLKKLKAKLKETEEKAKEYLENLQRAKADFVNMRKRDEEAKIDFLKFAKSDVLSELLPVLDALEMAVSHGDKGVEQTLNLFKKILKNHGLEEVETGGRIFDPNFHEAVSMVETQNQDEDHKILEVLSKGYILSGKVIRPAKVRIGEFKS